MAAARQQQARSPIGCTTQTPSPAAFNAWCEQERVLWPSCTVGVLPATGRGVVATADIAEGEVVVEVPDDAVLMPENCSIQEQLAEGGLLKPAQDALFEVQGLILAVMHERALGSGSRWGPYLAFLPSDMSHMLPHWSEGELEELRGTAAHDKLIGCVQHPADAPTRVQQLFDELVVPFVLSHAAVAAATLGKGWKKLKQEAAAAKLWPLYQWASSAVASYSFVLGDDQFQGMVPVWDLLNHITGRVNVRLHHDADRGVLQMIATEPIAKGAEVVNCYGHLSNAELLRGYGYVEAHNSVRHVQLPAHFLIRVAAAAEGPPPAAAAAGGPAAAAATAANGDAAVDREGAVSGASADAAGACDSGSEQPSGGSGEAAPSDDDDSGSSSGESSDEEEDEDEPSEPEWDMSDDDDEALAAQQQRWAQQQQQPPAGEQLLPVPSLSDARDQMRDWDDRWLLCFSLGLLPKNGVFQVPAGGMAAVPGLLLAVLLVLLADAAECQQLVDAAAAATHNAAKAAAAAAAAADAAADAARKPGKQASGGSKGHSKKQGQQQQQEEEQPSSSPEAGFVRLAGLHFTSASTLHKAGQLLVALMQCRYTCSLEDDQQLLTQLDSLAPRLAAAVVARSSEKEIWQQLQQDLRRPDAAQQLMQQARHGLEQALQELADKAAAKAAAARSRRGRSKQQQQCCDKPSCHHHQHAGRGAEQQQEEEAASAGLDDKSDDEALELPKAAGRRGSKRGRQAAGDTGGSGKQRKKAGAAADGAAASGAGEQQGFAFDFAL